MVLARAGDGCRFLGALVGMPFHELGHAIASWLGSRIAVPLPFFTIWLLDQSWFFGALVSAVILWFGYHSWREQSRFGLIVACMVLVAQGVVSWVVSTERSAEIQLLGGALGEIILGAGLLAAFHFPLPDRLRDEDLAGLRSTAMRARAAYGPKDSVREALPSELTEPFLEAIDRLTRAINRELAKG